jgi:hypothetical protein
MSLKQHLDTVKESLDQKLTKVISISFIIIIIIIIISYLEYK